MPQIAAAMLAAFCCFPDSEFGNFNNLVLIAPRLARDARAAFANESSGNPRGRPAGIRNPKRRIPDLVAWAVGPARPQAAAVAATRRAILCRRPLFAVDPVERLGIDLPSSPTPADVDGLLQTAPA